ncbi:MAG TPA: hypothetical protein VEF33_02800, partial [Syntrophales bacterium]|nr:hypothetical protein [Syntrophales bacterium]
MITGTPKKNDKKEGGETKDKRRMRTSETAQVKDQADKKEWGKGEFSMVGIGASAGGVEVFEQFFNHMPSRILEAFFKHSITPIVFLDKNFNFIMVNEAYARACQ